MKNFEVLFPSNIKKVNEIVRQAQDYIVRNIPYINDDELFDIRLILSELLLNAIIHGNGNNQSKLVKLNVSIKKNTVYAAVSDQGEGFDYKSITVSDEPSLSEHGRGISLALALADSMVFKQRGQKIIFSKRVGMHV